VNKHSIVEKKSLGLYLPGDLPKGSGYVMRGRESWYMGRAIDWQYGVICYSKGRMDRVRHRKDQGENCGAPPERKVSGDRHADQRVEQERPRRR
jgi:hypothetical protein